MTTGTFFLPGPTEVRQDVLAAMTQPMIPHRGQAFSALFESVQHGLKQVFRTERPVLISTSSATGLMEAGIRNAPDGPILSLVNGAFSERFAHIAEACGRKVDRYVVEWGAIHDPAAIRDYLDRKSYAALTVVHSETSTGALNPVRAISDVAHEYRTFCLIDSVSGLGGAQLETDAWNLDYVLTGSQKALALPPGLAFAVASDEFLSRVTTQRDRGVYFDLGEFVAYAKKHQAPNTPAISLYYALAHQLASIVEETMPARWERHAQMAARTHEWASRAKNPVKILAPDMGRSPTVTTLVLPESLSSEAVVSAVADFGITIGTGYGKLKDSTIRIGHMGDHSLQAVVRCLETCSTAFEKLLAGGAA